jgi:hypothetical protein
VAKITFANDSALFGELGDLVRAGHDAVAASDALVVEVTHNAGDRLLVVGQHRAAEQARGLDAVVAGRGHRPLHGQRDRARTGSRGSRQDGLAHQQPHLTPALAGFQSIERMAGGDASLAAGTAVEIHLESVLLARPRRGERDEMSVLTLERGARGIVPRGEGLHSAEMLLLADQRIDQRADVFPGGLGKMRTRHDGRADQKWSHRLGEQFLQPADLVSNRERLEGFARAPMTQVGAENSFHRGVEFLECDALEELASHRLAGAESAADKDVIPFAGIRRRP